MPGSTPASRLLHDDTFRRLCRARDLLAAEYQSQVPLDQAAREACLSPFHFHRLFRTTFGETPHDFLTRMRMERARRLLASGEMTVTEVCFDVGYSSLGSFSSKFQALAGRNPSEYQREVRRVLVINGPGTSFWSPCVTSLHTAGDNSKNEEAREPAGRLGSKHRRLP